MPNSATLAKILPAKPDVMASFRPYNEKKQFLCQ